MAGRINWLRFPALLIGVLVFLAHVMTIRPMGIPPHWLHVDWEDVVYHATALGTFALAYRLSFARGAAGGALLTVLFCSGWGAACEIMQHWIPARDFSVIELGVNTLTPLLIVGLLSLIRLR